MKKLCYVATVPVAIHVFLRDHIEAAAEKYEVVVICNQDDIQLLEGIKARLLLLPIERKPSLWIDVVVLFKLFKLFHREQFDIVHTHMPKAGLLGMLAARLAGVPVRINTFHGEVWVTQSGWRRTVLKLFDRLVGLLATDTLAVSPSQRNFLVSEGVLPTGKAKVIGAGSICGVDPSRFHPNKGERQTTRGDLGIAQNAKVILFVGRLNRDKGVLDLAAAFNMVAQYHPDAVFLIVGAEEDVPFSRVQEICHEWQNRLHYVRFTTSPERYMVAADVFCLPSYREGFPMTIIESAACGVPTVASSIYGIIDAVEDGKTGLLFPVGDVAALARDLMKLIGDEVMRRQMGEAGMVRALALFSSKKIIGEMLVFYDELLDRHAQHQAPVRVLK